MTTESFSEEVMAALPTGSQPRRKVEILPSDLLNLALGPEKLPGVRVAVDTETSGLRTDEGARIATVSVSWIDWDRKWKFVTDHLWNSGIQTYREEELDNGKRAWVVSFAWPFDQGVAGTGKPEDNGQEVLWADTENLPMQEFVALLDWLELVGKDAGLSMQNAKFDLHQFRHGVRRWPGVARDLEEWVDWDTQNGNDLLFGWLPSTSLKGPGTATEYLWGAQESDEKDVISKYLKKHKLPPGRWDLMPWSVIARYADQDARLTARLDHVHQERILTAHKDWKGWFENGTLTIHAAASRRMALTQMLYRMEKRGLPFAPHLARQWAGAIQTKAKQKAELLPFRPATLDTAKHYWFGDGTKKGVTGLGHAPLSRTAKGAPSLTADDVGKLVERGLPGAEDWRAFAKLQRVDSMWYTGWAEKAGPDGRLRTSVRQNGTASGRFSVEGIQLQAIPHDYKLGGYEDLEGIPTPRALIGAGVPQGWELWEMDLANAEARVAALYADCQRMLELIESGADLHGATATELFHVEPGDVNWGRHRQVAKRANFSLIFGVGWVKLQADIEEQTGVRMSEHEVKSLITRWRALYPEYGQAIKKHDKTVLQRYTFSGKKKVSYIDLDNGERRWFNQGDIEFFNPESGKREKSAHKAFNQRVQANLAQFGIDMWLGADEIVEKYLEPEELETGGIVLTVHDSIVALLPADRAKQIVEEIQEFVVALWAERFPGVPGGLDATPWGDHS